ncbi:hypothetical protein, variant [Verruconis gallopava]|nr:hypothetical protein, variant [Verruconis gallopava]KIW02258.1 hypothetical protein, variant [Verruconis gallopava]
MNRRAENIRVVALSDTLKSAVNYITLSRPGVGGLFETLEWLRKSNIYPIYVEYPVGPQLIAESLMSFLLRILETGAYGPQGDDCFALQVFGEFISNPRLNELTWTGLLQHNNGAKDGPRFAVRVLRESQQPNGSTFSKAQSMRWTELWRDITEVVLVEDLRAEEKLVMVKHGSAGFLKLRLRSEPMDRS